MKTRRIFYFIILGVLFLYSEAFGIGPLPAVVAVGAVSEGTVQVGSQASNSYSWVTSKDLNKDQIKQVQEAINYLKGKGFTQESAQLQTMLNNSQSWFWKRAGSTIVYKEPAIMKNGKPDASFAETHGGPVNAVFNNGYIKLQNFFNVPNEDGIPIDSAEKKTRSQARILIHELEHLNTQANSQRIRIIDGLRDFERGPMAKDMGAMKKLGYTEEEMKIRQETYLGLPPKLKSKLEEKGFTPEDLQTIRDKGYTKEIEQKMNAKGLKIDRGESEEVKKKDPGSEYVEIPSKAYKKYAKVLGEEIKKPDPDKKVDQESKGESKSEKPADGAKGIVKEPKPESGTKKDPLPLPPSSDKDQTTVKGEKSDKDPTKTKSPPEKKEPGKDQNLGKGEKTEGTPSKEKAPLKAKDREDKKDKGQGDKKPTTLEEKKPPITRKDKSPEKQAPKNWDQMTQEERKDALKKNDPKAWDKVRDALLGNKKAGQEVIGAIDSGKQKGSSQSYNPLNDPNLKTKDRPVDLTEVKKFGEDFQKNQWANLDKKNQPQTQYPVPQPPEYTTGGRPPTTPGQTPPTSTIPSTADKTGIEVQVVGNAPAGKCIVVNGQLVPVQGYPIKIANLTVALSGPVNQTATSSAGGTFSFPEIPAGNYIISVKQWNYGMTKQNFVAPSGKSVKIVLKGSCPFLYVWTGQKYEKENDIFSVARLLPQELLSEEARQLANKEGLFLSPISFENIPEKLKKEKSLKDYYRIGRPLTPDSEGNYRLKIVEQAEEYSFTDWVGLSIVDHQKDSKIGISREGQPFIYERLESLSIQAPISFYNEDTTEVRIPTEAFQKGVVAITWQGFLDGTAEGHSSAAGRPQLALQRMNPQGQWQTVDWVYPRDEVQESFFVLKELGSGWDQGGKIRLKASSCHPDKYHRIDTLGVGTLVAELPGAPYLELLSATKSTDETVLKALQKRDGRYIALGPEESISLIFRGAPIKSAMERTFIFVSEGFYIPLPLIRLTSN
ncbi:MAG: hypothetical protein V2B13_12955 [Pseudomonadota bacterium]